MSNVKGKVIIITGASSGIGEATARMLAAQGAKVVMGARRRTDRLNAITTDICTAGGTAEYQALDVTKQGQLREIVEFTQHKFGRKNQGKLSIFPQLVDTRCLLLLRFTVRLIGARKRTQLSESLAALEVNLSSEELT